MKNILLKTLQESKKNRDLLSFYDNINEISDFYVGYVNSIFIDSILIASYDETGFKDGFILVRLIDIFKIEKKTKYLEELSSSIIMSTDNKHKWSNQTYEPIENGIDIIVKECKSKKILLTIKLIYQDYIMGFISNYDGNYLSIEVYSNLGIPNGLTLVKYEDIQGLAFDRKNERIVLKLINER